MPEAPTPVRSYAGRFALTAAIDDQRDNVSGRFVFAVHQGGVTLDLVSPLGNTLARVQTLDGAATLTAPTASGALQTVQGSSPEALAEQTLGWTLPVSGLPAWIEGKAFEGRPATVQPQTGPVESIEQDGWTIRIVERFDDNPSPRLLEMRRPTSGRSPAVQLRIVLDAPATVSRL